ncbi:MAG TPA: 2-succinyl-5-enolpyruvyl-6-hydroxy-3-cyclohexene-1-carboxylic-acid synthase [Candidatus Bathyarchaeia archaeon]|nr:2-succinyl-5-enolpyruvyl-6-hydroxy-3-cyclohexene-1-carboxylic-acid synthase [Candidatus Bathyarchaeia archaeon]
MPDANYLGPGRFVAALAQSGVKHACVTPGSRSTPLALLLAACPGLRAWSHVDERSAAFFALGLAKATRTPVVLACTSGTAAANFLPAIVEAHHARVPLVVLTADRPPELRDAHAGQTIDQLRLFGGHARWFFEVGTPEVSSEALRHFTALGCRAVAEAMGPPAGVVHLNFPFREPLVPSTPASVAPVREAGVGTRVAPLHLEAAPEAIDEVAIRLAGARRPLVVCGPLDDPDRDLIAAVRGLAEALDAPIVAEPTSNLRQPELGSRALDAVEALVRDAAFRARHVPDAVVRLGAPPTSKALGAWLGELEGATHLVVDSSGGWPDPGSVATHLLRGAPAPICRALTAAIGEKGRNAQWCAAWTAANARARAALVESVGRERLPFEAHAVEALARAMPAGATLYVGNSLAVRALDFFWPAGAAAVRVLANRGANGIDGFVSSVLGAAASENEPVVGLCGDLSFYHDLNGLLAARRHGVKAVFVVLNNDGGGIFDFLPVARVGAAFEEYFVTPHGLDFRPVVEMYGCGFVRVANGTELGVAIESALGESRTSVIELPIERGQSVAAHARAWKQAHERIAGAA